MERKPYRTIDEFDPEKGCRVFSLEPVGRTPEHLAIELGDVLYNLRSALDHLAFALAQKHSGPLNQREAKEVQFPICHNKKEYFRKERERRIGKISPAAQTEIDGFQPYNAGDRYESHPLYLLNELNIIDKHRSLLLMLAHHIGTIIPIPQPTKNLASFRYVSNAGLLQGKTEVAHYLVTANDAEMKMNLRPMVQVSLADGFPTGSDVTDTIRDIRNFISQTVFPKLRPFLS